MTWQLMCGSDFGNRETKTLNPWVRNCAENNEPVGFIAATEGTRFGSLIKEAPLQRTVSAVDYLEDLDRKVCRPTELPGSTQASLLVP